MKNKIQFSFPIKKWKPNLLQKLFIKLKIIKDKRFIPSKKILDEVGTFGIDPYDTKIDTPSGSMYFNYKEWKAEQDFYYNNKK